MTGSMKSSGERRTRLIEPSSWANLMTSACWVSTDRMTICCWPVRAVRRDRRSAPARSDPAAGGGGRSVPMTCMPWSSALTLVLLRPLDDGERVVRGLSVMTGNLSPGEAHDHVHVVAGLDDRADAGDLVDLDGHADAAGRAGDVRGSSRWSPKVAPVICWPAVTGCAHDLADDLRDVREGAGVDRPSTVLDLDPDLVGLDARTRAGCPRSRRRSVAGGRRVGPGVAVAAALHQQDDADERDDREEDPDEQDQTVGSLQVDYSPRRVTGGTTVAPA